MAKILVCVAWPYASGPRHLGHAVSTFIPADIFARYHRMKGDEVLMVGGRDVPPLRLPTRPGGPVRELRENPGSVRTERSEMQYPRDDAHPERDKALLLPAECIREAAHEMGGEGQGALAASRAHVHAELAPGGLERPADHPGPGVGNRSPGPRLRDEADLRLVRGGDGVLYRDERVGSTPQQTRWRAVVLERVQGSPLLPHRKRQHRVPHNLLARDPARI